MKKFLNLVTIWFIIGTETATQKDDFLVLVEASEDTTVEQMKELAVEKAKANFATEYPNCTATSIVAKPTL